MKKVLAIAPYPYLPFFSGGQKLIANFFHYLGKEVDLTVISTAGNNNALANTYRTIPLLKNSFARYYDRTLIKKIVSLVKQDGFDTIIWEHPYYAWLEFRVRNHTGVKTIIHTHNIEYQRFKSTGRWWWPILKSYEKKAFKKADALFFITDEDKQFATREWGIRKDKCIDLPFGIDIKEFPGDRAAAKNQVLAKHHLDPAVRILFFNGLLSYKPNIEALKIILQTINPVLLTHAGFHYRIIVCGKGLPVEMNSLNEYADKNIVYAGFTEEIETYYKAADLLLNPVQAGGGIKTKMVEAIGFGCTVISTRTGATGIKTNVCGDKLIVVADNDWGEFTSKILENAAKQTITPPAYYEEYNWENIVKRTVEEAAAVLA